MLKGFLKMEISSAIALEINSKMPQILIFTHIACAGITSEYMNLRLMPQFQLLVYACRGRWEIRYHIADYVKK
jgi:hypothetical protein